MINNLISFEVLLYISSVSILFPLLAGLFLYKAQKTEARILFWYIALAALVELSSTAMASRGINNLPLLHFFTVSELIILSYYFWKIFRLLGVKIPFKVITISFILFSLANIAFWENLFSFNTNGRSLEGIIFIFLSLYYLFYITKHPQTLFITKLPTFWASAAILVYFSGTLFVFSYSRLFLENMLEYHKAIWTIHSFFNISFNILLFKVLWTYRKA